jgi:hypothetical protein
VLFAPEAYHAVAATTAADQYLGLIVEHVA